MRWFDESKILEEEDVTGGDSSFVCGKFPENWEEGGKQVKDAEVGEGTEQVIGDGKVGGELQETIYKGE
ncbi:hypothetical protein PMIN04_002749 [Paraphaeosphaeria minitans]